MEQQKKSSFSGSLGFVLAAAGSAVGLGNIWRFPNLVAKHGGGLFIIVYIALVLLFGFALLLTDIAIGRKTGMNAGNAYGAIGKKWRWVGHLTFIVPTIILMYYTVIGGWILKYFTEYVTFGGAKMAEDGAFGAFISSPVSPIVFMLIYLAITAVIVYLGVEKGIEKFSTIVMPCLLVLIGGIAIYSLTLSDPVSGRTGLEGAAVYFVPNFEGLTFGKFVDVVLDAMNQMFYSLSVAMGIMITYGSYVKKDVNINKSVTQIQLFDTLVAILSGMMIVPAVCVFFGAERMTQEAGAGLMFVTLPKVFKQMGAAGNIVGILFFVMVAFAALTSSVSIMETVVASCMEYFHKTRKQMSVMVAGVSALAAAVICLGYNVLYFEIKLPTSENPGQLLDLFDYISNSVIMPVITILTCILIGWVVKPKWVIDEVCRNGEKFARKGLYVVIIKFVAPVVMTILLLKALGII